jgi:hypothetical protein
MSVWLRFLGTNKNPGEEIRRGKFGSFSYGLAVATSENSAANPLKRVLQPSRSSNKMAFCAIESTPFGTKKDQVLRLPIPSSSGVSRSVMLEGFPA